MQHDSVISVLPGDVVDRIAAGEVIERPASVVKELLENALDAGGRSLRVDVEGGGLDLIVVGDDGRGMSGADVRLSILRHATSKLRTADDLFRVRSFGFRGEALSSIASVSRLVLTSRPHESPVGTRLCVEAGEIVEQSEVGCPPGTTIEVRDLFFNTPARRKFMRAPATEQAHVADMTLRVLLGARRAGVVLHANGRRLLDVPEDADASGRVLAAMGRRVERVFGFREERDGVTVSGFITPPEVDRADAKGLWFFVNGRNVRDRMLQRAVLDGYRTMVPRGRYPTLIVHIEVDPQTVDVNVHPQKTEVRFADGSVVFKAVSGALAAVLGRTPWLPADASVATRGDEQQALHGTTVPALSDGPEDGCVGDRPPLPYRGRLRDAWPGGTAEPRGLSAFPREQAPELPLPSPSGSTFCCLRPLGRLQDRYLVCATEQEDGLVLIDELGAWQRLACDTLLSQSDSDGGVVRHTLLLPESLELPARLRAYVETSWQSLVAFGFEVEPVGPGRFVVRSVPEALKDAEPAQLVLALLDEVCAASSQPGTDPSDSGLRSRALQRCAMAASAGSGAFTAPGFFDDEECLLHRLDGLGDNPLRPDGRPIVRRLGAVDLEALFAKRPATTS